MYIVLLCIFCTNSINIYAGVNGLEVGQVVSSWSAHAQALVLACSLVCINVIDFVIGGDYGGCIAMA